MTVSMMMMAAFTSCEDEVKKTASAEVQKEAIVAELGKNSNLSEFTAALSELNFANVEPEELTVFAVRNGGMSKSALKAAGDDGFDIMRHIVSGKYTIPQLTNGQILIALDGSSLTIRIAEDRIYINGVELRNSRG